VESGAVTLVEAVEGTPVAGCREGRELLVGERRLLHGYLAPVERERTLMEEACDTVEGATTHIRGFSGRARDPPPTGPGEGQTLPRPRG
jgi:hypothetical protein